MHYLKKKFKLKYLFIRLIKIKLQRIRIIKNSIKFKIDIVKKTSKSYEKYFHVEF